MPAIILPQQTGFIQSRSVFNNVLQFQLAHDLLKREHRSGLFLKLDFKSAYDQVDHHVLWCTMRKMGSGDKFIGLIQGLSLGACILIHLNGAFNPRFCIHRGGATRLPLGASPVHDVYGPPHGPPHCPPGATQLSPATHWI
ncbi:hypothetical protein R1flu_028466 [Riccia fluitans]|uniref:Reverse transcriptase domain-containing protein n=1 Tax=Riccia fluitans TaxID=41844 RepID=A0ABD1XLR0_9MARC